MGIYTVAWLVVIFGMAMLGEATRRASEYFGARVVGWVAVLAAVGFIEGFVKVAMAQSP